LVEDSGKYGIGVTKGGYSGSRHHAMDRDCSCLLLPVVRVLL